MIFLPCSATLYSAIIDHTFFVGMGVFASRKFLKNDFLLHYAGELVEKEEGEEREMLYGDAPRSYIYFFSHNGKELWWVYINY